MKKFKIICILIFSFLFFLSCSIYFKHQFNIDGDYLSAFSTIIAATFAYYFYTDWKDEHKFNLLKMHQDYLKDKGARLLEHFRKAHMSFGTIEGSFGQDGEQKWIEGCVELRLLSSELFHIQKTLLEYKSCLSYFELNEILEKHQGMLEEHRTKISQINEEFISTLPFYASKIRSSPQCATVLESWKDSMIAFDDFCSVELSEFYFKYLKTQ